MHLKKFTWDIRKNKKLKEERGVSFEDVVFYLSKGKLITILENPNQEEYKDQKIYLINIEDYVYYVPFKEFNNEINLITIIPSRKMTKKFLR